MLQLFTISDPLLLGQVAFFHYKKSLANSMKPEDPALYHDACCALPNWDGAIEQVASRKFIAEMVRLAASRTLRQERPGRRFGAIKKNVIP